MRIYTVTVFKNVNEFPLDRKKVIGWWSSLNEAESIILNPECNISEDGYYKHLVVEAWDRGMVVDAAYERWWGWCVKSKKYVVFGIRPCVFEDKERGPIVNFAMG